MGHDSPTHPIFTGKPPLTDFFIVSHMNMNGNRTQELNNYLREGPKSQEKRRSRHIETGFD